jgi:hypothetical protein
VCLVDADEEEAAPLAEGHRRLAGVEKREDDGEVEEGGGGPWRPKSARDAGGRR